MCNVFSSSVPTVSRGRNVSICSFICFDREHPEAAAMCAAKGAELVLMPTACPIPYAYFDKISTRAATNLVGIAMANFANATAPTWTSDQWGRSYAADHTGRPVGVGAGSGDGPAPAEGIVWAEFDVDALRAARGSARGQAVRGRPVCPLLCRLPLARAWQQPQCDSHRMWL